MSTSTIWMMTNTQIITIWTPGIKSGIKSVIRFVQILRETGDMLLAVISSSNVEKLIIQIALHTILMGCQTIMLFYSNRLPLDEQTNNTD